MRPDEWAEKIVTELSDWEVVWHDQTAAEMCIAAAITSAVEEARAAGHAAGVAEERERIAVFVDAFAKKNEQSRWYAASQGQDSYNLLYRNAQETAEHIARAIRNGETA